MERAERRGFLVVVRGSLGAALRFLLLVGTEAGGLALSEEFFMLGFESWGDWGDALWLLVVSGVAPLGGFLGGIMGSGGKEWWTSAIERVCPQRTAFLELHG